MTSQKTEKTESVVRRPEPRGRRDPGGSVRGGTNLPAIGGYNQSVVLDAVRRERTGLSRVELAERTGLSAQTVSNVCRRLIDAGLVRETGKLISGPGKPRTILQLEPRGGFAVGVHVDPAVITYVVLDLEGTVVAHSRTPTRSDATPEQVVDLMAQSVAALIAESGIDGSLLLGVGIASPGPIDIEEGVVLDPPMIPRWRDVHLREALSEAAGLPVLIEKDVTAAVVAERWFNSGEGRRNFAFVYYGTGFGTGLVVGGEVVRGASSNAGDAGHITVDPDGPVCGCGRRGCVGDVINPRTLVRRAIAEGVLPSDSVSGGGEGPLDVAEVDAAFSALAEAAAEGDEAAVRIIRDAALALARAVVVIVNLLDLDHVVFGGPFWARIAPIALDALVPAVTGSDALVPKHPIQLSESAIGEDVAAIGAACLVLDHAFSPNPRSLLIGV
jgi:predicted NBD/HSP70 family sugar kinase